MIIWEYHSVFSSEMHLFFVASHNMQSHWISL